MSEESPAPPRRASVLAPDPERWISRTIRFLIVSQIVILILDLIFNYYAVIDDEDIQELFNVAREISIPNWFSSVQEAAVGLVFWLIHVKVKEAPGATWRARGWAVLSGLFFYIGLDDGTMLHERVSTAIGYYFSTSSEGDVHPGMLGWIGSLLDRWGSYQWQVLFGPVLAAFGLFLVIFLWRQLERKLALTAYLGLFLYGLAEAQDFLEGMETPYDWMTQKLGTHPYTVPHFFKMGEEYLEMLGTTVLLYVAFRTYSALRFRSDPRSAFPPDPRGPATGSPGP